MAAELTPDTSPSLDPTSVDKYKLADIQVGDDGTLRAIVAKLHDNGDGTFTRIGTAEGSISPPTGTDTVHQAVLSALQDAGVLPAGTIS